jgi:hypothetical protein
LHQAQHYAIIINDRQLENKQENLMLYRGIIVILSAIVFFPSTAPCQSGVSTTLKQLLRERIDAIASRDTNTLNRICTKNYQTINSAGIRMTFAELKASVIKTQTPIKQSTILSFQPFIAEDESMAFATFEIEEDIVKDSQNISKNSLIITEIYKKEKNRWKIQLTHSSEKVCSTAK